MFLRQYLSMSHITLQSISLYFIISFILLSSTNLLTKNDIGGNIGYYRLLTSLNCKEVHSFEPLYEYECYPIERNPIEHMSIFVGV